MRSLQLIGLGTLMVTFACSVDRPPEGTSEEESAPSASASETVWSIGLYSGPSVLDLEDPPQVANPILTYRDVSDIDATVVAHPFILKADERYLLFFTAKNREGDAGEIALAESQDGWKWSYRQVVLKAPYHLAYPYVFEWEGEFFMIPEEVADEAVRLYKAVNFPTEWRLEATLLEGEAFISASVAYYKDRWWMFVGLQGNETLKLYSADQLRGPWTEHPKSPIVDKNPDIARPGGRLMILEGELYRMGQDCYPTYGSSISAFRITSISPTVYSEERVEDPIIGGTGQGWNAKGMHHVDAVQLERQLWIALVDGVGTLP